MDAFQGSYRTEPRDMRYFSAFYLLLRVLILVQVQIFLSPMFYYTSGILSLASAAVVALFQPYKVAIHNTIDAVLLTLMGVYFISFHEMIVLLSLKYFNQQLIAVIMTFVCSTSLALYFLSLILWKFVQSQPLCAAIKKIKTKCPFI